jgi:hypothetical protein
MPIDRVVFTTGACVGSDDAATATGYSPHVAGKVLAVHVNYTTVAANPDLVMSDESDPASESILNLANQKTDIKIYPRRVTEKNDGTDILYAAGEEVYEPYVVHGRLEVTLSQADADDTAVITAWIER